MLRRKCAHSDTLTELRVGNDQKIRHNDPKLDKYLLVKGDEWGVNATNAALKAVGNWVV